MALILKRGRVPQTPHTEFYAKPGILSLEEIHGTYGFSGAHSRKMHLRSYPTEQVRAPKKASFDFNAAPAKDATLQPFLLQTGRMPFSGDALRARTPLVFGPSTLVSISKPNKSFPANTFFRNGEKHELFFVQEGAGLLQTEYGEIPLKEKSYVVIPKGTTYRIELSTPRAWFLIVESSYPITFPPHYLNTEGQAKLMSPVVETEITAPELKPARDERGMFPIFVKHGGGRVTQLTLSHHPFDVAGWEGALYPFAFDTANHHGIAREIHTAPPVHQTFQSGSAPYNGFSICSFIPQMEGWHPLEIPAPYAHFNVDSDEVMFFSNTNYGARRGVIEPGSFTFHPGALPHSPQGRAALKSRADRGKKSERFAVMLDTFFESLTVTEAAYKYRDKNYALSWFKASQAPLNGASETLHGT